MLSLDKFCFLIHSYDEEILDFILAASNIAENIVVIFVEMAQNDIDKFKPLYGFDIHQVYSDLNAEEINNHIKVCDKLFLL